MGDSLLCFAMDRQTALDKSPNSRWGGTLKGISSIFKSSFNALAIPSLITPYSSPFVCSIMMRIRRKSQDNRKLTAERVQEYNWLMESTLKNMLRELNGMESIHASERKGYEMG